MGIFGYLLATLALSQSKYQLPHYIYIASPMACLLMAGYVDNLSKKNLITWGKIQLIFNILLVIFVLFTIQYVWEISVSSYIMISALLAIFIYIFTKVYRYSFIWGGVVTSIFVNILLLVWFYPNLLEYQSASKVGKKINKLGIQDKSFGYQEFGFTSDFYSKSYITVLGGNVQVDSVLKHHPYIYLYTNPRSIHDLKKYKIETVEEYNIYHVTLLTFDFLNPKTRKNVVQKTMLLKIQAK
jgi:hypothetical protein